MRISFWGGEFCTSLWFLNLLEIMDVSSTYCILSAYIHLYSFVMFPWTSHDASRISSNLAHRPVTEYKPRILKYSMQVRVSPRNEEKHLAPLEMAKIPRIPHLNHMATERAILELSHSSLQGINVHTDFRSNILPPSLFLPKLSNIMIHVYRFRVNFSNAKHEIPMKIPGQSWWVSII